MVNIDGKQLKKMTSWFLQQIPKKLPKLDNPILIEGLPGIGNVGKVSVDFIIESIKAKPLFEVFSYTMPNSVFVNDEGLVELPNLMIYYKKRIGKRDILFLSGDVQPVDEVSSYEFSELILDVLEKFNGREVVTLGGIGLKEIKENPVIYITGTDTKIINKWKRGTKINAEIYGVVGPIIGVTGLLVGLAGKRGLSGISLLVETLAHPLYLGINGSKKIINLLNKKLELKVNIKKLDKEIKELKQEIEHKSAEIKEVQIKQRKISYIG